jgi:glyoxylase-like metal-dependent hydrolase (beta-lactamase superfamily II)
MSPSKSFGWLVVAVAAVFFRSPDLTAATTVAPGIHLIPGTAAPGSQPDGNSIIIDAPEGLIVVDTGRHPAHTQQLIEYAAAEGRPIRAIVNSHWHLDHVGGNVLLRAQYPDTQVYASSAIDDALTGFLADYRKQLETVLVRPDTSPPTADSLRAEISLIDSGPALRPTQVISRSGRRVIAGRPLEIHLERSAVTAGDVWIFDRKTRVLISGDLVTLPAPFLDTACPTRWAQALARLAAERFEWLIPGHGAPMRAADVATYRQSFDHLLACSSDKQRPEGECIDGWLSDSGRLIPDTDRAYSRALLQYYVTDVLRGDPARLASQCKI